MMKWFSNPEELETDRRLFAAGEALLDEEGMALFLATLKNEKAYRPHPRNRVLAYMRCCEEIAPQFKDRQLREKCRQLATALNDLRVHTATHFHVFPRDQKGDDQQHALHPDYFILEMNEVSLAEHQFYCNAESDLLRLVETTAAAYRAFRAAAGRRKLL
jgi:hypothetical protein